MSFQVNLRTLRLARGLTQPALAEKAEIEQSYLSKLENGRSKPSEDVLARLAGALDTTSEALANGDELDSVRRTLAYTVIGVSLLILLALAFFAGRITSIYSINPKQVVAGSRSQPDLTQQIINLAPVDSLINGISLFKNALGEHLNIDGIAPSRVAVNDYLTAIRKKFGGEFESVSMVSIPNTSKIHFQIIYFPHGIAAQAKAAASDPSASKN